LTGEAAFTVAGARLIACGSGILWWPAHRLLAVADLHLEKGSAIAARGRFLPPYDTRATLERLEACIAAREPEHVVCLGDSFHDNEGCDRLPEEAQTRLRALTEGLRWTWITGNHDAALVDRCGGRVVDEAEVDGVVLRHRADPREPRPEMSGHFHPKYRAGARGRSVSRPCFVASATKLIFPAFGSLTGGLAADHREIVAATGRNAEALVAAAGKLLRFPLAV